MMKEMKKTSISEMTTKSENKLTITDDGCMRLAAAIVANVIEDYQKSVEGYHRATKNNHQSMMKQYEYHLSTLADFIKSDYCANLVFLATGGEYNLDGDEILKIINKKCQL